MITTCSPIFIIAIFLVILANCDCKNNVYYAVPTPKIDVFPKGFRIAIPDQEGINLFAFHGNINRPMNDLEAGQYSRDILKKENGHWVFEDSLAKLKVGDVIYYWLFVIRFNLGYRYDNGEFVVKEIKPCQSLVSEPLTPAEIENNKSNWYFEPADNSQSSTGNTSNKSTSTAPKPMSTCCQLFLNSSNQLTMLSEQMDKLSEENRILSVIAEKNDYYATTLQIFGKYSSEYYPTPKEFVQNTISEILKLADVKVLEAKKIPDNGISFKVESLRDKLKIIMAAEDALSGTNYELSW